MLRCGAGCVLFTLLHTSCTIQCSSSWRLITCSGPSMQQQLTDTDPPICYTCAAAPLRARLALTLAPFPHMQCSSSWRLITACSGREMMCGPAEPSRCRWCGCLGSTMQVRYGPISCACSWRRRLGSGCTSLGAAAGMKAAAQIPTALRSCTHSERSVRGTGSTTALSVAMHLRQHRCQSWPFVH